MNRLAGAASAYLASAAHQPVAWYPWGDEAFSAARDRGHPILLDIGAVWCHWCHVMDRESYEDPALADFLNRHFVCVKVDRDERPDVDARYQRAVQAIAGQGGWPLTAFLTADGDVFYGGTYFPPDGTMGRPGFRTVLEKVLEASRERPADVAESARRLREHVAESLAEAAPGDVTAALLDAGAEQMARAFDVRHGGFGSQPKFPHPAAVEFLLGRWWSTGEGWMRDVVERTLDAMALGGMHDQLGGGFHRYAVDARWIVPHFEKMAYDNAELLKAYLHGYAALGKPLYRHVSEGIVRWAFEVLADRDSGGFGASQDADVGLHDDGDHFTWTEEEARAELDADEWEAARRRWDIGPQGEMPHDPRRNVLFGARTPAQVAAEMGVEEESAERLIDSAGAKLLAARRRRPAPYADRTVYTAWNAMLAEAFLEAAPVLGRDECRDFALRTLERLWAQCWVPGEGFSHRPGTGATHALLDDQVQAASAALAAFEHTGSEAWLRRALDATESMQARFRDAAGGYYDTADDPRAPGLLGTRSKPIQDAPTPSGNAVAALVFLRLHALTGEGSYRTEAEASLRAFAGGASALGVFGATYFRALDLLFEGMTTIVVADTTTSALEGAALATYRPWKLVLRASSRLASHAPHLDAVTAGLSAPYALVCGPNSCSAPVRTVPDLRSTMESFGRTG